MSGGGGTNTSTTVQSNQLAPVVDAYLKKVTPTAQSAYKTGVERLTAGTRYTPSQLQIAGFNDDQTGGIGAIRDIAQGGPSDLLLGARDYAGGIIDSGGFNDPMNEALGGYRTLSEGDPMLKRFAAGEFVNSNPFTDDVIRTMQEDIRNQVAQQWAGAGQAFEGQHAGALGKELTDSTLPFLAQNYENEISRQLGAIGDLNANLALGAGGLSSVGQAGVGNAFTAAGMQPGLDAAMLDPGKALLAIGDLQQQQQQRGYDATFDYRKALSDQRLQLDQLLAQLGLGVGGSFPGAQSSTTSTTSPREDNTLGNILGLGLGAGALFL